MLVPGDGKCGSWSEGFNLDLWGFELYVTIKKVVVLCCAKGSIFPLYDVPNQVIWVPNYLCFLFITLLLSSAVS